MVLRSGLTQVLGVAACGAWGCILYQTKAGAGPFGWVAFKAARTCCLIDVTARERGTRVVSALQPAIACGLPCWSTALTQSITFAMLIA